ncbi:MAG: tRNA (N(6)-L-threonylcarbamoyladenosine(37)-C(2))-methylthiotransferase MtaB, partial [Deltaproteobacteria bacterium]|nr:tRNA (N(6)-L-threonylcarbamoyladenosine(37)-C(2))-methylthiotransferase MtaB [Deltaproteobacteria bacterium]
ADFYVINSCAITAEADADARNFVHRAKRANPEGVTIVTGCSAQVSAASYEKMEEVDHVIGNISKDEIVRVIQGKIPPSPPFSKGGVGEGTQNYPPNQYPPLKKGGRGDLLPVFFGGGVPLSNHSRAFLKIQDGCSQFCSFCIVPFARGLNRSVEPDAVLASLHDLGRQGIPEVVLTGIHLGTYGKDLKPRTSFEALLSRIASEKPVPRVRVSSLDPEEVTEGIIDLMADEIFCPHFHLPLQSGDDGLLKSMRRRYNRELFRNLCARIRHSLPDAAIGTDVIVGFPGEGEEEFSATQGLIEETDLAYLHVFPYSTRVGTKAATFSGQVDPRDKKARSKILRDLSLQKKKRFHERFIGHDFQVVLQRQKGKMTGLTGNYISIELDCHPERSEGSIRHAGKILRYAQDDMLSRVRITSVTPNATRGELIH